MAINNPYPIRILLLDPAPQQILQFEHLLIRIRACEIESGHSLRDALQQISLRPPDLIITEWRLKDHSAEELIKALKSREEWKSIPLVVCSDQRHRDVKQKALAAGASYFLWKPVNPQLLRGYLELIYPEKSPLPHRLYSEKEEEAADLTPEDIKPQLSRIQTLAPLPMLAQAILEIGNDPRSSASDLKSVIEKDQPLTAKILKTVNSAYYGFHRKIGNIDRAIVILGFNEIMNITLAACIIEAYRDMGSEPLFDRRKFWIHALGAAYIARALTTVRPGVGGKDAFVIGLLHDFGKVVLDQHFHKLFSRILQAAASQKRSFHQVATEIAGVNHAESWKLPPALVQAIRYHHAPELGHGHYYETALAHLANYYCHKHNIGASGNPAPDEPSEAALEALAITRGELDGIWSELRIDLDSLRTIL